MNEELIKVTNMHSVYSAFSLHKLHQLSQQCYTFIFILWKTTLQLKAYRQPFFEAQQMPELEQEPFF